MAKDWEWDQEYRGRRLNFLVLDGRRHGQHTPLMSLRLLFWLIMILILIFALFTPLRWSMTLAMPALGYVLFCILGWKVFGPPLRNE